MSNTRTPLALLVGAAVAAGSSFSMEAMAKGYMQDAKAADAAKAGEGKCGEGKCAAGMKADAAKPGQEGGCGMAMMDADKDGRISRAEFATMHKDDAAGFAGIDANGDGFIDAAEMKQHMDKPAAADAKKSEGGCGEGKCGAGKCGGSI